MDGKNREFKLNRFLVLPILFGVSIIVSAYNIYQSRRRDLSKYASIVVARVVFPEFERKTYLDKNGKGLDLEQYTFLGDYGIKIGDSLVKQAGSDTLVFYRKSEEGKYRRFGHRVSD